MPSEGVTRPLPELNGAYGNDNRREFERPLCRAHIQRPSVGPPAMGRFRASADRALVNGAALASPPSASIANAHPPLAGRGLPALARSLYVLAMAADALSSNPYVVVRIGCRRCTRKGSYRLARLAAKYGAEIPMIELLAHLAGDCAIWDARHPGAPRCGAYFVVLDFPAPPPDRPTEGMRSLTSSKAAAPNGAPPRRRAPPPLPERRTAARPPRASQTQPPAPRRRPPRMRHRPRSDVAPIPSPNSRTRP